MIDKFERQLKTKFPNQRIISEAAPDNEVYRISVIEPSVNHRKLVHTAERIADTMDVEIVEVHKPVPLYHKKRFDGAVSRKLNSYITQELVFWTVETINTTYEKFK